MSEDFRVTNVSFSKNTSGKTFATVSVKGPCADDPEEREEQVEQLRQRVSQLFTMSSDHMVTGVVDSLTDKMNKLEEEVARLRATNTRLTQENTVLRRNSGWNP